ncbi:chemotaxis protein [Virgibacillus phasianinus]|uniref:Chemotaxis protein n=1 Tax=Virgibacillus phasianinus TaxID=2017483 RepID=A0A220U3U2_9BACI|nr:chemotaxis protein [Virgibacillus phasianinus]ASK62586.1 chemotaxis protein [Virgibacillus phasianinus]
MTQKIAIAFLHGAGTPDENFAEEMIRKIKEGFSNKLGIEKAEEELVVEAVFWSAVFEKEEKALLKRLQQNTDLDYTRLRRFVVEFLADAVAYQPTKQGKQNYDLVNSFLAESIRKLKEKAGPNAPLCMVSHSLGSVVASNYFYDLQFERGNIGPRTNSIASNTPIEQAETLALFYTMGSPLALWAMRFPDFGVPIHVPSPGIRTIYPNVKGEWVNFYDKDDVLAFPLKGLNKKYQTTVTADIVVRAGGWLTGWTPLSHSKYNTDSEVIKPIVEGLVRTWKQVNGIN